MCQTIQCLGRVASKVPIVTEQCLNGLMSLLTEDDESVVGESVVVIKKLLQINPEDHRDTIRMLSRLATTIAVPAARASILWLLGEYSGHVPKIAPDVLRQLAKTFCEEEDVVKLQILNLAAKLYLTNQKQTKILLLYVLQLGKYDVNYDIRDRSRYIRAILMTKDTKLHKHSKHLFLSKKPAPALVAHFTGHDRSFAVMLGPLKSAWPWRRMRRPRLDTPYLCSPHNKETDLSTGPVLLDLQVCFGYTIACTRLRSVRLY